MQPVSHSALTGTNGTTNKLLSLNQPNCMFLFEANFKSDIFVCLT